jgi:hypothetical protein
MQSPGLAYRMAFDDAPIPMEPGNIDLNARPVVKNADGSVSTVRSIGVEMDGKTYLLPTVTDDGRIVSDDEAVELFRQTGKHLGIFRTGQDAEIAAKRLHDQQATQYAPRQLASPAAGNTVPRPCAGSPHHSRRRGDLRVNGRTGASAFRQR